MAPTLNVYGNVPPVALNATLPLSPKHFDCVAFALNVSKAGAALIVTVVDAVQPKASVTE